MNTDTRLIPLTQGKFTIVDTIDYEWAMQWKWYADHVKSKHGNNIWYAARTSLNPKTTVRMHRAIAERIGLKAAPHYDHKDHDGLNNRRYNIRPSTVSQNIFNSRKRSDTTSQFKGVWLDKRDNAWIAEITINRERFKLGRFKSEWQAHLAYVEASEILFGEFSNQSHTNFRQLPPGQCGL